MAIYSQGVRWGEIHGKLQRGNIKGTRGFLAKTSWPDSCCRQVGLIGYQSPEGWRDKEFGQILRAMRYWRWGSGEADLHMCMLSRFGCVRLFAALGTVANQDPLSMEFSRQEYWSGLPCPPSSRGSSQPRDQSQVPYVSCTGRQALNCKHHLGSPRLTLVSPETGPHWKWASEEPDWSFIRERPHPASPPRPQRQLAPWKPRRTAAGWQCLQNLGLSSRNSRTFD